MCVKYVDTFSIKGKYEFNSYIGLQLRSNKNKVVYYQVLGDVYKGGFCTTVDDAMSYCKEFYNKDNNVCLGIGDYSDAVCIYEHMDILNELKIVSDDEYNAYLSNLNLTDYEG